MLVYSSNRDFKPLLTTLQLHLFERYMNNCQSALSGSALRLALWSIWPLEMLLELCEFDYRERELGRKTLNK